jgi:methionyl-tRNA synthetase
VATYGNAVNRVLTFVARHFDGQVPTPGALEDTDQALLDLAHAAFDRVGTQIEACHFKDALREVMSVAQELNRYIDSKAPWATIKTDRAAAGTTLYVCLQVIGSLAVLTAPFLPHSARRLWTMLGFDGVVSADPVLLTPDGAPDMGLNRTVVALAPEGSAPWTPPALPPGQQLGRPEPLFKKLDEDGWEEETARLMQNLGEASR